MDEPREERFHEKGHLYLRLETEKKRNLEDEDELTGGLG